MTPGSVVAVATVVSVVFSVGCMVGALLFRQGVRDEERRIRNKAQVPPVRVVPRAPGDDRCMDQSEIDELISQLVLLIADGKPPNSSADDLARHAVCLLRDQNEPATAIALGKELSWLHVDPRFGGVSYGPSNDQQRPVEVRAFCLPCKAPGLIVVSKLPGTTSYEVTAPDGWLLGYEPGRSPLTLMLICPTCLPEYRGLVPPL